MRGISARVFIVAAAALVAGSVIGQEQSMWPERAKNLQQLPADLPPERLEAIMRSFTRSLGVRCSFCHAAEEGQSMASVDFSADVNPRKLKARKMLAMLGDIEEHLEGIEPSGTRVNVWCHTCHHGVSRPQTLSEALGESYAAGGIDAATARYQELRERYYGSAAFDFSERGLPEFGATLFDAEHQDDAVAVYRLNVEQYPQSTMAWGALAGAQQRAGDIAGAIATYEKMLELDPGNGFARRALNQLREQQEQEGQR